MEKEKFVAKLLENGFLLEEEWLEDGVALYHNKELKSPIFLIDKSKGSTSLSSISERFFANFSWSNARFFVPLESILPP